MKSKSYLLKIFLLTACYGFLTSGCKKLYDYIQGHGDGDYKACNIKKLQILYYPPFEGAKTDTFNYQFTYNVLGNPVSVINDHVGTGNGNFFFKYDRYNRLREFTSMYTNGYETWHRYGCNDKGQVVRDTMHIFGVVVNGVPVPSDFYYYFDFAYDSKNRISTETVASYIRENLSFIDKKTYIRKTLPRLHPEHGIQSGTVPFREVLCYPPYIYLLKFKVQRPTRSIQSRPVVCA